MISLYLRVFTFYLNYVSDIVSSLGYVSLRSHLFFELTLEEVDIKLYFKFQLPGYNSFLNISEINSILVFLLGARYAFLHFARNSYSNLH